jgi:hypothetical protein
MTVLICLALVVVSAVACGAKVEQHSPWQSGFDIRAAPGLEAGTSDRVTIHPTVAYSRSLFGGVEGETESVLHLGGQVRMATAQTSRSPWFGGEATYARRWTTFDDSALSTETTNGWTLAGLAGVPVFTGSAGTLHVYGAGGAAKFGGSGPYFRIGIDFQPAFLKR